MISNLYLMTIQNRYFQQRNFSIANIRCHTSENRVPASFPHAFWNICNRIRFLFTGYLLHPRKSGMVIAITVTGCLGDVRECGRGPGAKWVIGPRRVWDGDGYVRMTLNCRTRCFVLLCLWKSETFGWFDDMHPFEIGLMWTQQFLSPRVILIFA